MLNQLRFLALFVSTCLTVVMLPLFRRLFSLVLCGLLFANSSLCHSLLGNDRATAASSGLEEAPSGTTSSEFRSPQEIAVPPIIREAPIDLQNALPDDFVVSRQTPYSSGRNEVLIVSPSTGTEQRFEINLPGTSGSFRLYQASFDKVMIDDPVQVVGDESSISSGEIQAKLESFTINFDSNNLPASVILADGSKAEFSGSEVIIRSPAGQAIETILLSSTLLNSEYILSAKSSIERIAQIVPHSVCLNGIRDKIYNSGEKLGEISNALKKATSINGKILAWALTYGKRGLEDSLVAGTRNQTLPQIACNPPVRCDEPRDYEGRSEIRTDLFQLSGGRNQQVSIRYEFYDIPDRMEIYAEGRLIKSIPEDSGYTDGSDTIPLSIEDGVSFLGIKLIGNEDTGTKWNYTVSCSGESPCPDTEHFKLTQHPYLYSTSDPFVSPRPSENENFFGSDVYHHYVEETSICSTSSSGCTTRAVFQAMISQRRFMAPAEENEFEPVVHCGVTNLQGPGWLAAIASLRYSDYIINVVDANTFTAINYTLDPPGPNNTHTFHPGRVIRTVVEKNGTIIVRTEGEGTGPWLEINEREGPPLFKAIDLELTSYFMSQNQ